MNAPKPRAGIALKPRAGIDPSQGAGIDPSQGAVIAPNQGAGNVPSQGTGDCSIGSAASAKNGKSQESFFPATFRHSLFVNLFFGSYSDHKCFRLFRFSSNSSYAGSSNTTHKQQCKPQDGIARISCLRIIRVSCIIRSGSGSCILFPYSCIGYILCYGFFYLWIPSFERISFSGRCFSIKGRSRFILRNDCRLILENLFNFHAVRICYGIAYLIVYYFVIAILTKLCNGACICTVIFEDPIT